MSDRTHFLVPSTEDLPALPTVIAFLRVRADAVIDLTVAIDAAKVIDDTLVRLLGQQLMIDDIAGSVLGKDFLAAARAAKFVVEPLMPLTTERQSAKFLIETPRGQMLRRRLVVVVGGDQAPVTVSQEFFRRDIPLDLILAAAAPPPEIIRAYPDVRT